MNNSGFVQQHHQQHPICVLRSQVQKRLYRITSLSIRLLFLKCTHLLTSKEIDVCKTHSRGRFRLTISDRDRETSDEADEPLEDREWENYQNLFMKTIFIRISNL